MPPSKKKKLPRVSIKRAPGKFSREKGKRFERRVATILRDWWPTAIVRRASQAERAYNSDVFVEGGPALLQDLWLELTDGQSVRVAMKLKQAERDIEQMGVKRIPIVVWHRARERDIQVTTSYKNLARIASERLSEVGSFHVTIELTEFLSLIGKTREGEK